MSLLEPQIHEDTISSDGGEDGEDKRAAELERHRQMQLTLQGLQRTMDPMIAARVYNDNHSPLARLPQPILQNIIEACIDIDVVSVHCLLRVCQRLRRIIHSPPIWEFSVHPDITWADDGSDLPREEKERLRRYIQMDFLCAPCKLWFDLPAEVYTGWFKDLCRSEDRDRPPPTLHCNFDSETFPTVHCEDCGTHHENLAFSPLYRDTAWRPRCLGRQGGVQLCEHKHVFWVDIENHISHWRSQSEGEDFWDECISDFHIECRHSSHDARCTPDGSPTWPRASLMTGENNPDEVLLRLEWRPHSGPDAFNLIDGRIPAPDARELFQRHQEGAAGILCPSWAPQNHPPAMMCFDPRVCSRLDYKGTVVPNGKCPPSGPDLRAGSCPWDHEYCNCHKDHKVVFTRRGADTGVRATQHSPTKDSLCLVAHYWTGVRVCSKTDDRINPDHGWFHAMDPDTYDRPYPIIEIMCKDRNCLNYYRRPRSDRCMSEGHRVCDCFQD